MEIKQCSKSLPTGEVWWGFSFFTSVRRFSFFSFPLNNAIVA